MKLLKMRGEEDMALQRRGCNGGLQAAAFQAVFIHMLLKQIIRVTKCTQSEQNMKVEVPV